MHNVAILDYKKSFKYTQLQNITVANEHKVKDPKYTIGINNTKIALPIVLISIFKTFHQYILLNIKMHMHQYKNKMSSLLYSFYSPQLIVINSESLSVSTS